MYNFFLQLNMLYACLIEYEIIRGGGITLNQDKIRCFSLLVKNNLGLARILIIIGGGCLELMSAYDKVSTM